MNKCLKVFICLLLLALISSCGNTGNEKEKKYDKLSNLDELKRKYFELEFENCDQILGVGDEMIDVYIRTIDKAFDGNLSAKDDLENFDSFMSRFDKFHDTIESVCPDKFDVWTKKMDSIMQNYEDKLLIIFRDEDGVVGMDEDIENDLELQILELNEELLKLKQEDSLFYQ